MKRIIISRIIDFIYPKTSVISEIRLEEDNSNEFILDSELSTLRKVTPEDLRNLEEKLISDYSFSYFAFYENEDFSKLIYNLKYRGMKKLGIYLGELTGRKLNKYIEDNLIRKFD
ncbi:MAG: hypothetical protein JST15_07495, partial [Bacteroidetes bacterium]|nr:hypothetical protein [Bacteroidota bacterium]